ncbi:DUF7338 family protein [Methylomonas sp. HW2-6]|uniref:DUF7338 family protein n=1 Tax=Methylomonas sp. HW2-6 TaxID=3376687 RepID=UPI004040F6FB
MTLTRRIMQWLLYLPLHLLVAVARYPLAPIAVASFTTNDKRFLLFPFTWLETIDNDLSGDDGWRTEHIRPGSDPLSLWNRIRWLWRNGGNRVNYMVLGCPDDPNFRADWSNMQDREAFWIRDDGYWMIRGHIPIGRKYLYLFVGWSLFGPLCARCKFTCTIRIKANKPG